MKIFCLALTCFCLLGHVATAQAQSATIKDQPKPEAHHPRKFVEFAYTSFAEAQPNLDNMAAEMRSRPELIGYIYVYAGRRACVGEARTRGASLKRYIVDSHGLADERVVWKDGGHREEATVELWVLPPVAGEPSAMADPEIKEAEVSKGCEGEEPKGAGTFDKSGGHNKGLKPTRRQRGFLSSTASARGLCPAFDATLYRENVD